MGKLLALEVHNFKSYKGHHVLHFGDSYFTSIIGPNGSGKSNSMDAISFVLGIKSAHLRSTHLKDLIYRGRVLKQAKINADGDATEGAPIITSNGNGEEEDVASDVEVEVESIPTAQRNDPHTAWVMAIYEDDAGEEQRWKRSINSSGVSEYRLNNRVVTAKQYNEALEAENVLIRARNFLVFQGDIESIAQQNPKDITQLIEQISGSLEYKAEYDRLKIEKEAADKEQQHRLQQRRGINGEIRNFQQQKEELMRFEGMRDDKDDAIIAQVLWKLFHFQRTIEDSTAEIHRHQEELKEFRRNVKKFEDKLEQAKREQANAGRDVTKIERETKRKEKDVEEIESSLIPVNEKLSISSKSLATYQKQIAERTAEKDGQQKGVEKQQSDLAKVQKAQQRWEDEWRVKQQQAGQELSQDDMQEYQRLRGEVYKRSGNDQIKVDNVARQLKTDEETMNSLKSKLDDTQAQTAVLSSEITSLTERRAELTRTTKATQKEVEAKKAAMNKITSERTRNGQKRDEIDEKLRQVLLKLDEATHSQRETRKEAEQRETVAQMKRIFSGVKGMVHQLCKPKQKKYEVAVPIALGRQWDSVIVDSEKTAKECIQYLKEQRAGIFTFLPLDTIISNSSHISNLRGMMQQGMRLAIDTIEYDHSLERAMSSVCGNAVVTDNLKIARYLCYEKKVDAKAVTLDGTIIHKGGNMTGGESAGDKKRRFEDKEVENLRALAHKYRDDIEHLPRGHDSVTEGERLSSELDGLLAKTKFVEDELKAVEKNVDSKSRELDFAKRQVKEVQPQYEEQARGVEALREQLEQATTNIQDVQAEIFGEFCRRLGYANIHDYDEQQGSLLEEANQKRVDFAKQISRLQNMLSFGTQHVQSTSDRILKIQKQMKRDQDLIAQLEEQKEELSGRLDEVNAEIEHLNTQLAAVRVQYEERGETVTAARAEVQKRNKSVEKTLKSVSELETAVQSAGANRYGVLRQCKVDNVALPLIEGSRKIDALPLEDAILAQEEEGMDVDGVDGVANVPLFNSYGIEVDFTDLDDDLKEDDSEQCGVQLEEKIVTLTSDLDKMAPNMRSAERLEATSERLKATEREFNESRIAARNATKAFDKVRDRRTELFKKAFEHISEQIGSVYRELTKTATFPLGGTASLSVEDDDEPYLSGIRYHAMPPLKRFRDMELLSGGEKTMAALALLFAVHTYAPSPFFVLDEVDAALDNANTAQLATYVREHAGPGMQFVVISLKTGLFQESETLVGVMRDQGVNSSRVLTLDLRKYQAVA